jgi:phage host-nuclease inhibitor protein Gam
MTIAAVRNMNDWLLESPDDARADRESWAIRDMDAAAWAARKLATARAEIAGITAWEEREVARVRAAADTERKRHASEVEFFEGHLGRYLAGLVADGRKTKTLSLPAGSVSLRARQPLVEVDEPAALEWARAEAPDVVKVRESIDKAALKKRLEFAPGGSAIDADTGEVLPFVTWQPQSDGITFTPTEEQPA